MNILTFKEFLLTEGVYDPSIFKAIFLAGGGGSGKSFVGDKVTGGLGFRLVNSDELFEYLLKKKNLSLNLSNMSDEEFKEAMAQREIAKKKTLKKLDLYLKGRLGLIIDGTARDYNKIKQDKQALEKLGYDTFMVFVNTSLDVAKERNKKRERKVPEKVVEQAWKAVQENIGKFQGLFGNNFVVVDNSTTVNPNDSQLWISIWKQIQKFSKKSVSNPQAKAWIEREKYLKKR